MTEVNENHNGRVKALWEKIPDYCSYVETKLSVRVSSFGLIKALTEATNKELQDLALEDWDNDKIINAVKNTKFLSELSVIEEEVFLDETIIPDKVIRGIGEERVKFKGEKWVVHKNDADPFPSKPHAHNYESGLKLHLGNGDLYSGTKKVSSIQCKKLKQLRALFKKVTMPTIEC